MRPPTKSPRETLHLCILTTLSASPYYTWVLSLFSRAVSACAWSRLKYWGVKATGTDTTNNDGNWLISAQQAWPLRQLWDSAQWPILSTHITPSLPCFTFPLAWHCSLGSLANVGFPSMFSEKVIDLWYPQHVCKLSRFSCVWLSETL